MSRFNKLSHSIWHCQYRIVFAPKYRYKVLKNAIAIEVRDRIIAIANQKCCEVIEINVQVDHVHLLVKIPPKLSVSKYVGTIKGKTAIYLLNMFRKMRKQIYWGNHFWAKGYCVDTVGLDTEMIRKYVKYQDKKEEVAETSANLFQ